MPDINNNDLQKCTFSLIEIHSNIDSITKLSEEILKID